MFTGIIKNTAKAKSIRKEGGSIRIAFPVPKGWTIQSGESINIDGICTTVEKVEKENFQVYYMPETVRVTSLAALPQNHTYNLERCLTLSDLIGGHLVYGHIDATGKISKVKKVQNSIVLEIQVPANITRYMVYKGSVAVNGVSLTIVAVDNNSFTVSLIPYTLSHTNLGDLKAGDSINIEVDMLAKHIEKLIGIK